ncbi:hypothetical protein J5N97_020655 [Dioscorea zingiberensis]|uniref:Uncharacterized protein n=1 Tax=Dioscorea zingiberensis TaxID=325984 RepID=A0A9D5CG80_9LILI|nr:hypothetical protein J5N97_020655 [Dioscorea zingiberensis]
MRDPLSLPQPNRGNPLPLPKPTYKQGFTTFHKLLTRHNILPREATNLVNPPPSLTSLTGLSFRSCGLPGLRTVNQILHRSPQDEHPILFPTNVNFTGETISVCLPPRLCSLL